MSAGQRLFVGLLIAVLLGGSILYSSKATGEAEVIGVGTLEFHVELKQGWNLLVWTAEAQSAETIFAAIAEDVVIAYGWQPSSQSFSRYISDNPDASTITELERNNAYWLLVARDVTLSLPAAALEPVCPPCIPRPPCPTVQVPATSQQACSEARMLASHREVSIAQYQEAGLPTTYLREELAAIEAWLNTHCR